MGKPNAQLVTSISQLDQQQINSSARRLVNRIQSLPVPPVTGPAFQEAAVATAGSAVFGSSDGTKGRILPRKKTYSVYDFLKLSDVSFIESVYRRVLLRLPDESGTRHYLGRLRDGRFSKIQILGRIRFCREGRKHAIQIDGLTLLFLHDVVSHIPLIGPILNALWPPLNLRLKRLAQAQNEADLLDLENRLIREKRELSRTIEAMQQHTEKDLEYLLKQIDALSAGCDASEGVHISSSGEQKHYAAFEDAFRGSEEEVKEKVLPYLEIVSNEGYALGSLIDLGCGRGEWLELCTSHGIPCQGIDTNKVFVDRCRNKGLNVRQEDVFKALADLPDESVGVITSFHLIEHLPRTLLYTFLDEIQRVLVPRGLLILETPNPENLLVGACDFYTDLTHERPLPPSLVVHLCKKSGFDSIEVMRMNPVEKKAEAEELEQRFFLCGRDYGVVARKKENR